MTDFKEITRVYELHRHAVVQANALNKERVFDALARAKITLVNVDFNGESDQGQVENVRAYANNKDAHLPSEAIEFSKVSWNTHELDASSMPLSEAIETLSYDYLEQEHGGWENNEGAYGEFTFHVAERSIELSFDARIIDTAHYSHSF